MQIKKRKIATKTRRHKEKHEEIFVKLGDFVSLWQSRCIGTLFLKDV